MKNVILKYNRQVPRYTSYPSAPHFQPLAETTVKNWLAETVTAERVSLYVHIPFCRDMCWYCGCHTTATRRYAPVEEYITLLLREIKLVREAAGKNLAVSHIHFGGGSPTMLQGQDFARIMTTLRQHFTVSPDAEIAIEADPRYITHDLVDVYAACGVNRMSFGVQDFAPHVQKAINRVQNYDTVADAVELCRAKGIRNISFDLMYGLPLQTRSDMEGTVASALTLSPQRISLFGYAHVPWMKKHMRLIRDADLPDGEARLDLFADAEGMLRAAGLMPVGLDHFVMPEDDMYQALLQRRLRRNFQGYSTDDAGALLGFGLSAIGQLPQGYVQNFANLPEYSNAVLTGSLPVNRGCQLSADDRLRAAVIEQLMCYFMVDVPAVCAAHGQARDYLAFELAMLVPLADDGLVTVEDGVVTVNPAARQAVRIIAAQFDAYFAGGAARHSQVA